MSRFAWALAAMLLAVPLAFSSPADKEAKPAEEPRQAESPQQGDASTEKSAEKTERPPTHTVATGPLRIDVTLDGVFLPAQETPVSVAPESWSQFRVLEAVAHGQTVRAGEVLVRFDPTGLEEQIRDVEAAQALAEFSLQQAQAELAFLEKSTPLDLAVVKNAKQQASEDLKYFFDVEAPQLERVLDQQLKRSRQYMEYAREELDQLEKMYKADDLTEETEEIILTRARNDYESAKFSYELSQEQHERMTKVELPRQLEETKKAHELSVLKYNQTLAELPRALSRVRLEIEKQQYDRRKAGEKLAELKADLAAMVVKAPVAGVVYYGSPVDGKWSAAASMRQKLRPGGQVVPYEVLMTVVPAESREILVAVPEKHLADIQAVKKGQATLTADDDVRFRVRIDSVAAVPLGESFPTRLQAAGLKQAVAPGMTCQVVFTPYQNARAVLVPKKSVHAEELDPDAHYVYRVGKEGKAKQLAVEVGYEKGDDVEIVKGLQPGDKILLEKPKP